MPAWQVAQHSSAPCGGLVCSKRWIATSARVKLKLTGTQGTDTNTRARQAAASASARQHSMLQQADCEFLRACLIGRRAMLSTLSQATGRPQPSLLRARPWPRPASRVVQRRSCCRTRPVAPARALALPSPAAQLAAALHPAAMWPLAGLLAGAGLLALAVFKFMRCVRAASISGVVPRSWAVDGPVARAAVWGALPHSAHLRYAFTCCRADADLRLLSKRKPPPGAFKDKVVWIVGASQVSCKSGACIACLGGWVGVVGVEGGWWGCPANCVDRGASRSALSRQRPLARAGGGSMRS